jgi:putative glutamine amidotransferase
MARPVIGISCYVEPARWGAWDQPAALLPASYVDAITRAGGRAVLLPPDDTDTDVLDRVDALMLCGGPDVDARLYGAAPHPTADVPRESRDAGELALYRGARDRGLPFLGVCRGLQIMAVAHGGTLIQHLPEVEGTAVHREAPGTYTDHVATFADGTLVARILGAGAARVNSSHHQCVDDPGDLTVTGRAADGTIEVCENHAVAFSLGVQWHPEVLTDPRLFDALVAAARTP